MIFHFTVQSSRSTQLIVGVEQARKASEKSQSKSTTTWRIHNLQPTTKLHERLQRPSRRRNARDLNYCDFGACENVLDIVGSIRTNSDFLSLHVNSKLMFIFLSSSDGLSANSEATAKHRRSTRISTAVRHGFFFVSFTFMARKSDALE